VRVGTPLVPAGLALIAVSYGLARFAYGLFLPAMRDDVDMNASVAGAIGSGAYLGYCVAIVASAWLVERFGPRRVAVGAGAVAALGMAAVALSTTPWMLAAAVLCAGISTGLASPPMAAAVAHAIPAPRQPRANAVINSGTSIGVALSGPIALVAAGNWREAYGLFAVLAAATTLWLAVSVPDRARAGEPGAFRGVALRRRAAAPVLLAAAIIGFASAAFWTFAGDAMAEVGTLPAHAASLAWIALGVAGLLGAGAGDLIRRFGVNTVHRVFLAALGVAGPILVLFPSSIPAALTAAAVFGAAYIMLTGVYLIWGIRVYRDRPAFGLGLPFLMVALGQALGAPVAGALIDALGYGMTFSLFAAAVGFAMACVYRAAPEAQSNVAGTGEERALAVEREAEVLTPGRN
jgi:predicted MFS family arabinose efflux permease